jgi:hypothetical protein
LKSAAIFATVAAIVLTGCQTAGSHIASQSREKLNAAPVCCKTIAEAKIRPLPALQTDFELSANSQAFYFDAGKAFFDMFELPTYNGPYSILIGSRASGSIQDMSIMAPWVILLDENFQPTRSFDENTLRPRGSSLERTIFINPGDRHERYMVIFGSPIESSRSSTVGVTGANTFYAGGAMFSIPTGSDVKSKQEHSPTGSYFLDIKGLQKTTPK